MIREGKLGRLKPATWEHVEKYPLKALRLKPAKVIEKRYFVSVPFRKFYNQGREGACVGYSCCIMMTILNRKKRIPELYSGRQIWNKAKEIDEFSWTNPGDDNGTTVDAGLRTLKKYGTVEIINGKEMPWDINDGIDEYRWATSVDEMRQGIEIAPIVLGVNWYSDFDVPMKKYGVYWIGRDQHLLGAIRGGHAICCIGASDKKEAFRLCNSWGLNYPIVWIPYKTVERLLKEDGESGLVTDRK